MSISHRRVRANRGRLVVLIATLPVAITSSVAPRYIVAAPAPASPESVSARIAASLDASAMIDADGRYSIRVPSLSWTFAGRLGAPVLRTSATAGSDAMGPYHEIGADYGRGAARHASIRCYDSSASVLLTDVFTLGGVNADPFPRFTSVPSGLSHISYPGVFGASSFTALDVHGPIAFFDTAEHGFILGPASDPTVSRTVLDGGAIGGGIAGDVSTLPAGTSHSTLLTFGEGVNALFDRWGSTLRTLRAAPPRAAAADPVVTTLGYWTDNGASYYYAFDPALGYEGTLLAVRDVFLRAGVRLGYMQLDSWWYPKGSNATWSGDPGADRGGISTYVASPELFPGGLAAFQRSLGLPLAVHARWIDPSSPYRRLYRMSRNVIVDPSFWSDRASYLRDSGVAMYEQDWMNDLAAPEANLTDAAAFLGGMASSMQGQGLTVQYCSPLSGDELASVDYGNVTTTRVSVDRFTRAHWDAFLYDSRLAAAVELRPFTDVMMSTETDNLLLATLSTGPVGVGDAAGGVDARNLRRVARADGVIVKPDAPLLPTDAMYVADATSSGSPMVAATSTVDGTLRALYVVEYPRGGAQTASFSPAALGLGGRVFVYDWLTGSGSPEHGPTVTRAVTSTRYLVVVPIGPSGIGFVGDVDQFVTLGKQRVEHVSDDGALHATVLFAAGESSVTVGGFAPHRPDASASDGRITSLTYDASTQQFRAVLAPGDDHRAAVSFSGR